MAKKDKLYLKYLETAEPKFSDEAFVNLVEIMDNLQKEKELIINQSKQMPK